MKEKKKRRS